jgi:predicted chitinase
MYTLVASSPTVLKKVLKQSFELSHQDKRNVLPGKEFFSSILKSKADNHFEICIDGETWFIYAPHWTFHVDLLQLSVKDLQGVFPYTPMSILGASLPSLQEGIDKYQIGFNRQRIAAFLAQIGHESGGLRYTVELASGQAYEWRKDLGNVNPGDGVKFKGRGWIQLTGRHNYRQAGKAIGVDLEAKPELAADPKYLGLLAGWFWSSRNLNYWADKGDFEKITRLINGGLNGYADRLSYWQRAKKVLGI